MEIIEKVKEKEIPAAEYCDKYGGLRQKKNVGNHDGIS